MAVLRFCRLSRFLYAVLVFGAFVAYFEVDVLTEKLNEVFELKPIAQHGDHRDVKDLEVTTNVERGLEHVDITKELEEAISNTTVAAKQINDKTDTVSDGASAINDSIAVKIDEENGKQSQIEPHNRTTSEKRYLFPLDCDNNGPSVHHLAFREAMFFAIQLNRSLVELNFGTHWTTDVEFRGPRYMNQTFDVDLMKEIIDLVTLDDFKKNCNSTIDKVLFNPKHIEDGALVKPYAWGHGRLQDYYGIRIPNDSYIPKTNAEAQAMFDSSPSTRCLGLYIKPGLAWEVPRTEERAKLVNLHFQKPVRIRKMAEDVTRKLCDGKPYMAVHWRNKSAEDCNRAKTKSCPIAKDVALTAKSAAIDIRNFMQNNSLFCIYVALPPYSKDMLTILRDAKVPGVKGFDDISTNQYPEIAKLKDPYEISLLEQEICTQSKAFLGTKFSAWTRMARLYRDGLGKPTLTLNDFVTWKASTVSLK
ncbi:uncharacterized protein LOC144356990 [Saccoglossus kowalevskii]